MISWICSLLWTESICLKSIHAVSFAENAFRFRFIINSKMWPPYFKKVVSMVWKGCLEWRVFSLIVNVVTTSCDMTLVTVSGKTSIWHTLHYVKPGGHHPQHLPASIWPLIGPHWSWMSACPPRVIHSVLVTGTKPGLYLCLSFIVYNTANLTRNILNVSSITLYSRSTSSLALQWTPPSSLSSSSRSPEPPSS